MPPIARIPVPTAKRVVKATLEHEQSRQNTIDGGAPRGATQHSPTVRVRMRNKTGSDLAVGSPVLLRFSDVYQTVGAETQPAANDFRFDDVYWGYSPTSNLQQAKIGVTTEVVPADAVGQVVIQGVVPVWANILSPLHLSVTLSGNTFFSSTSGFPIIAWQTQNDQGAVQLGGQYVQIILNDTSADASPDDMPQILVTNASGIELFNRNLVGIGAPLIQPNGPTPAPEELPNIPWFYTAPPNKYQPFAVLLGGALNAASVRAITVGVLAVQIGIVSVHHDYANVQDGNYVYLESSFSGPAKILWKAKQHLSGEQALGLQWCFVSIGQGVAPENYRAVTTTTGSAASGIVNGTLRPGTGFAKLYVPPTSSDPIANSGWTPGETVLYENWMHTTIDINKPVLLRRTRKNTTTGGWLYEIVAQGCQSVPDSPGGQP